MGFITLGSGHTIHASLLPVLNPPGSIEVVVFNEATGDWEVIVPKDCPCEVVDLVNENFWRLT